MNDVHIFLRRGDPSLALLPEAVRDEYSFLKLYRVDTSVGAAGIAFDHIEHTGTAEALEYLSGGGWQSSRGLARPFVSM